MPDQNNTSRSVFWQCVLAVVSVNAMLAFLLLAVTLFAWGRNQALTPQVVQSKLRLGMSVKEVEYALGLNPGSSSTYSEKTADDKVAIDVVASGSVGSLFVPQHQITLVFNRQNKLEDCLAEIHWQCDEEYVPIKLAKIH